MFFMEPSVGIYIMGSDHHNQVFLQVLESLHTVVHHSPWIHLGKKPRAMLCTLEKASGAASWTLLIFLDAESVFTYCQTSSDVNLSHNLRLVISVSPRCLNGSRSILVQVTVILGCPLLAVRGCPRWRTKQCIGYVRRTRESEDHLLPSKIFKIRRLH